MQEQLNKRKSPNFELSWLGTEVQSLKDLEDELHEYWDILLGRVELPIDNGIASLMETSVAIHTRVQEITALIQEAEYQGTAPKGSSFYRFRTGPLRDITEASKRCIELGSRRITMYLDEQQETRASIVSS